MGDVVSMDGKRKPKPQEIHVLCCAKCEGMSFLLADEGIIYCGKCIERVSARWSVPEKKEPA